jgi:DNA-binding GntR family transcriptional regulator
LALTSQLITECAEIRTMINSTVARRVPALAQLLHLELCHSLLELMEADLSESRPVIAIWSDFFRLSGEFRKEEQAQV